MNKKCVFVIFAAIVLILSACFSPWKGDEGAFSINIGGGGRTAWNDTAILEKLEHTITLNNGPGPEQIRKNIKYGSAEHFLVIPGRWNITVTAFLDKEKYAAGFNVIDIKPGRNGVFTIKMTPVNVTELDTYTVTFETGGGAPIPPEQNIIKGGKAAHPVVDPTRDGWDFMGWYTDTDLTEIYNFDTPITGNITLYARWQKQEAPVNPVDIIFEITFEEITDINKPVITKIISSSCGISRIIIKLKDSDLYSSINWYIKGITGSGTVFILDLWNDSYGGEDGKFHLMIEVLTKEGGKPYSQTFIIENDNLPEKGGK
jgi:uncharacterized repeat protein (TIGR02543 family)